MLGTFLSIGFLGLGALVALYHVTVIPDPSEDANIEASTVYFAPPEGSPEGTTGTQIATFAKQRRELVEYSTLPEYVGNAVVASEDNTFWENRGVSIRGMARAFLNNIQGGDTQGASTLTQQYVERYYVGKTTSDYLGKAKETLLAIKIGQEEEKPEILERYLNTIYYGRDSYGIQMAAKSYFGKTAAELSISEAALLAGIIPSPNNWDPAENPDKAEQRWNGVLDRMVTGKFITAEERAAAVFPTATLIPYAKPEVYNGPNGYILEMVENELKQKGVTKDILLTGGLKVVTTIQEPLQAAAQTQVGSLYDGTLAGETPDVEHLMVGLVSIDTRDGAIVSMYGGKNFIEDQVNNATRDVVQAGSTFKPFTLIAALEQGVSLETTYPGASPLSLPSWGQKTITNFDNGQFGDINLVDATADSVNTVYAQLNDIVTPQKTSDTAAKAGITTDLNVVASNVLGSDSVHPIDMATAYATIAANGIYHKPFIVREATYIKDGSVAYRGGSEPEQRFAADVMADTTYAMTQVVERGSGKTWVKPLGRPIAGKTGTSTGNQSAWFVGFTPQIATAVALSQVGENMADPVEISTFGVDARGRDVKQITGATWPAALWAKYMATVFEQPPYAEVKQFPKRANVGKTPTPTATPTATEEVPVEEPQQAQFAVPGGLEGKLQADAEAAVVNAGLKATVQSQASDSVAAGRVISVNPGAGSMLASGGTVTLVVSTGPNKKPTPVPTVTQPPVDPAPTPTPTPTATQANNGGGGGGNNG